MSKPTFKRFGKLIKWPQCVIVGEKITIEQAKEILSRTDIFFHGIGSNQREFDKNIWKEIGYPAPDYSKKIEIEDWEKEQKFKKKHKIMSLDYLHNSWISSCYIGGVHGWCNPDGTIRFWDNIGKWPEWEDVYSDCKKLAKEFPFLNFKICLYNQEGDCEEYYDYPKECVGGFKVENGKVRQLKKSEYIDPHAPETRPPFGEEALRFKEDNATRSYINNKKAEIFGENADKNINKTSWGELFFNKNEFREYFKDYYYELSLC